MSVDHEATKTRAKERDVCETSLSVVSGLIDWSCSPDRVGSTYRENIARTRSDAAGYVFCEFRFS